jgi:hypothetical protein
MNNNNNTLIEIIEVVKKIPSPLALMCLIISMVLASPCFGKNHPSNVNLQNLREKPKFLPGVSSPRKSSRPGGGNQLMPAPPDASMDKARSTYFLNSFDSFEQFDIYASLSEGVIKGSSVKFLIDNRNPKPQVSFMNGNFTDVSGNRPDYVQFHYYFAQRTYGITESLEAFNNETYFTNELVKKKFIAGTLQLYEFVNSEGNKQSILGIQFYPQDVIAENTLLFAVKQVKEAVKFSGYPLAFVAYGSQQTVKTIGEQMQGLGVNPMTVEQIYSGISYVPMQKGTTYGFLRFLKFYQKGEALQAALDDLGPLDIPVFEELPLDLSVVAGVITTVIQDAGAHVNLKSKERSTPNMVLKDKEQLAAIESLNNKPIKLVVGNEKPEFISLEDQDHDLEAANAIVQKFHADRMAAKKSVRIKSGKDKEVVLFDTMAQQYSISQLADKASSYGGKASKLALLASEDMVGVDSPLAKKYSYRLSPMGFSIPVDYYFQLVKANPILKMKLDELINKEMALKGQMPPSPKQRAELVKEVQSLFYQAAVPESLVQEVAKQAKELISFAGKVYPKSEIKKVKVRSSSNAEDIPQFDGAGLHSSYAANIHKLGEATEICKVEIAKEDDGVTTKEEIVPNTLLCAIKGVYASLWNKRAIEERNFAKIHQRSATMGIAINVGYDFRKKSEEIKEVANAVLVTRIINAKGIYGYRLSLNTKDNLVTNPTPQTQSEIVLATFLDLKEKPQYSFIQFAKLNAASPVMDKPLLQVDGSYDYYDRIIEIARYVESNYCKHFPKYYPYGNCTWVVGDPEKPSSLDMEFKIYSNGEVLIKQVREFSGQ